MTDSFDGYALLGPIVCMHHCHIRNVCVLCSQLGLSWTMYLLTYISAEEKILYKFICLATVSMWEALKGNGWLLLFPLPANCADDFWGISAAEIQLDVNSSSVREMICPDGTIPLRMNVNGDCPLDYQVVFFCFFISIALHLSGREYIFTCSLFP